MVLGNNIRIERARNRITQEQLAEKIGVSKACISLWENNKSSPSMRDMAKLKKILNLNVDKILEEMENEVIDIEKT
ncbi:helix-turn-helix domain-containing protein [Candidatus Uabimicrobium sp. HlEnr_7]|uniref:helix-turn-helix domain-containing protein n=1 Tax=Candidatus Uabimicrobium helgolandensis TaxID=3095367 RepID=UPI003556CDD5